ncbi:DUF4422 domain-containing protein [Actinobacillus sp. GY-402]|nr:DUF4422 domain-containing protein [Actinobacillus sp. GY-402]
MKDIKIFICNHKKSPIIKTNILIPIHAGKANSSLELDIIGDNTGDNISERNSSWCELTVIYWMWKNVQADYYGLFHYRRFLNFNDIGSGYSTFNDFSSESIEDFGWDDETIEKVCSQYDVISSPIWGIHPVGLPQKLMTNYDFYAKEHFVKDLDIVIQLIKERSPDLYPYALKSLYSKECFFANMMIMKKEYFYEYCEWVFDILFEAEKIIDISKYDSYQKRIWGFIAERLSNCFLEYLRSRDKELKYTPLGMVFGIFEENKFSKPLIESNLMQNRLDSISYLSDSEINIVFAIDDNYARHCAVAINSILDHINSEQKIRFFIICDNTFSEKNKELFRKYENNNISFTYLEVNVSDFSFYPLNREHISIATYYRLALQDLLPKDVNKVIYLDADLVVMENIAKLWDIDLEDNFIGGALDEGGVLQIRRLGLPLSHNYINAGICVMNIKKMRELNLKHLYAESLYKNCDLITLQDQDILNITFVNKIKKLPLRWNVQSRFYKPNELEYAFSQRELEEAAMLPAIIHYSDREKPWQNSCRHLLKSYYDFYKSQLSSEWLEQYKINSIFDFISYDLRGDKAEIFLTIGSFKKSIIINREFGKKIYGVIKYIKGKIK